MASPAKNTICLWYDRDAEEAASFYARTFPDSRVNAVFAIAKDAAKSIAKRTTSNP